MKTGYLFAALVILSVISLFIGVEDIGPADLLHLSDMQMQILFVSRIPALDQHTDSGHEHEHHRVDDAAAEQK